MTRGQRAVLAVLAVAVVLAAVAALVFDDDDDDDTAELSADAATTSSTLEETSTTTSSSTTTSTTAAPSTTTLAPVVEADAGAVTAVEGSAGSESSPTTEAPSVRSVPEPTAPPAPAFQASIEPVTAEQLGSSWQPGCPVGPEQLLAVNVSHWGYDGAVHIGRVIVDAAHAQRVVDALHEVYDARFPIERMVPIDRYGSDDQASMRANNTSAFNCRYVAGTTTWSEHSYGQAIDINPLYNPYVKGSSVDPPEGAPYADRSRNDPGMIHARDAVVEAFARQGWKWGGYWSSGKDYQHFSASGR